MNHSVIHLQARQIEDVQEFREKIKRKQAAAIVIQSAWRGHKVRVTLEDADLSNRDICHWYQVKVRVNIIKDLSLNFKLFTNFCTARFEF